MKFYFIINTVADFNFQYNLIKEISKTKKKFEIIILKKNLKKAQRLQLSNTFLNKINLEINKIGIDDNKIKYFNLNEDFFDYFLSLKGNIIALTTAFKQILLKTRKPLFQKWFAISYFNESNEIYDFVDVLIVSSNLDKYFIKNKSKVFVGNPYIDFFNETNKIKKIDKEIIYLIPEIIENKNWYQEITEYISKNYDNNILYILKLRFKTSDHNLKKTKVINYFKNKKNIVFFDSPFYDCNLNLLNLCDKIILTDRKTSFIIESSFFKDKIHILDNRKINYFQYPANNEYYEYLNSNKIICDNKNNSKKLYSFIINFRNFIITKLIISLLSRSQIFKKLIFRYRNKNLYFHNLVK